MSILSPVKSLNHAPHLALFLLLFAHAYAQDSGFVPKERDLAIILPNDDSALRLATAEVGFTGQWLSQISSAFARTSVGRALESENRLGDWQVVSIRVDPCQSLIPRPHSLAGALCWPEVRLVVQPVVRDLRALGRIIPYYADDRAVHVLFDFEGQELLGHEPWITGALADLDSGREIDEAHLNRFLLSRDKAVQRLLSDVRGLRDPRLSASAYAGHDLRPESTLDRSSREFFKDRLQAWLEDVRLKSGLPKEITAFSLPEGREPAHLDEWVFLQFVPVSRDELQQKVITVQSASGPETLVIVGPSERVTMARDADVLYTAREVHAGTPMGTEFEDHFILFIPDIRRNAARIADDQQVRVANTSCASCHKLNSQRFDFHNLSYLEERPVTISPRVVRDVEIDLEWLKGWRR